MRTRCSQAEAWIRGDAENPGLFGKVAFISRKGGTLVTAQIHGLPDSDTGFFAFHIHEGADCWGKGFPNTGSHYNPGDSPHPCHAGDLPPLLSCGGDACMSVVTDRFRVEEILGRTVVIHSNPDDFRTQPSGDAGNKIACGVICPC